MVSKSAYVAQGTDSKPRCHHRCRRVMDLGSRSTQPSILFRSHPAGKNPSISDPEIVSKRFMASPCEPVDVKQSIEIRIDTKCPSTYPNHTLLKSPPLNASFSPVPARTDPVSRTKNRA